MHVRDPKSAAVEVRCSYWGDERLFLNRSPYVDASLECGWGEARLLGKYASGRPKINYQKKELRN